MVSIYYDTKGRGFNITWCGGQYSIVILLDSPFKTRGSLIFHGKQVKILWRGSIYQAVTLHSQLKDKSGVGIPWKRCQHFKEIFLTRYVRQEVGQNLKKIHIRLNIFAHALIVILGSPWM